MKAVATVAFIWQRFLPMHVARMRRLHETLGQEGYHLWGIEVAARDDSYAMLTTERRPDGYRQVCCFPERNYHGLTAGVVRRRVLQVLREIGPNVVFAPATPFPEGMAAYRYRMLSGGRAVLMDDAWEHTDRSGFLTRTVKRWIHRNVDGAFVPAQSHAAYFRSIGFTESRLAYGVDVVDNDRFREASSKARARIHQVRQGLGLPTDYFIFVGRLLVRKGVGVLLEAYERYRRTVGRRAWGLVLVGSGPEAALVRAAADRVEGIIPIEARDEAGLIPYYAAAQALVVPSLSDPWALVVNEGLACGLPVIVSRGCGSARVLVREGENGWTFEPGDVDALSRLMDKFAGLPGEARLRMGDAALAAAAQWTLDTFVSGVRTALAFPRRKPGGLASDLLTSLWRGKVRAR